MRDAADRDYRVFVVKDAGADREPDVHEFFATKVFPSQARVVHVADLEELLSASADKAP